MSKNKMKETESTAIAVISPEEQAYLDSLLPERKPTEYKGPNRLVINTNSKDKDGVKRTIGAWHIENTDVYFDGIATFRPVRYAYKLIRYNNTDNVWSVAGQSVYFNDFSEEILDSLGGIALGRKFGSKYSQEEKDASKDSAMTYLDIFGFVKFGDSEELHPVLYRVRGGKLMKMLNAFKALPKDKRYSQYNYTLEAFQPEGKTYWDINVVPDMSETLPITPVLTYDASVLEFIRESNSFTLAAHKKNRTKTVENTMEESAKANMESASSGKKARMTDDEIPF